MGRPSNFLACAPHFISEKPEVNDVHAVLGELFHGERVAVRSRLDCIPQSDHGPVSSRRAANKLTQWTKKIVLAQALADEQNGIAAECNVETLTKCLLAGETLSLDGPGGVLTYHANLLIDL